MDHLFREEAVSSRDRHSLGEILLARPMSLTFLGFVAALIALTILGFLFLAEYTRKERVTGQLSLNKGLVKVYSQVPGVVVRRLVGEGDRVKGGQPLYILSIERNTLVKGETQAEILKQIRTRKESKEAELGKQKQIVKVEDEQLRQKIRDLETELSQLRREVVIQRRRVELSSDTVVRYQDLVKDNYVSQAELDGKEQDLLDQRGKLESLQRTEISIQRDLTSFKKDLQNMPLRASNTLASIERDIASIEQEILDNEVKREVVVVSLQEGMATAVLAEAGQTVNPMGPLLSILPEESKLEGLLYVPSRAVGFVETGNKVLMRYQAYPYQKFGQYSGTVREIARTALQPDELKLLGTPEETYYRIVVTLDAPYVMAYGKQVPLQDGMQLEADILLDTRKLYEWVLEPLYSLTGKL
jgi:membrane fusion protein